MLCMKCGGKLHAKKGVPRKDGSFPRYYACHWGTCSETDLKIDNKARCVKTFLIADDLELYILDNLTFLLTGNPILLKDKSEEEVRNESEERIAKIFGNDLEEKIKNTEGIINRLEAELERKMRANIRLLKLLEEKDCTLDVIMQNFRGNQKEIDSIKEKIAVSHDEKRELEGLHNSKQIYVQNSDSLFDLWCDLQDLSSQDKKRMTESLIPGRIKVWPVNSNLGPDFVSFEVVWNDSIFEQLQEEGKLPSLGQNGTDHSSGPDSRGGDRDHQNFLHRRPPARKNAVAHHPTLSLSP